MGPTYHRRWIRPACASPCSTSARMTPAVPSGRSVSERPFLSANVYISFATMSVVSPTPRWNSSVASNSGVRISR